MSFNSKRTWDTIKAIRSPRLVLPALMAIITQHERYIPEVEWNSKLITYNVFRVYELIFGRRDGIKAEASVTAEQIDGRLYEVHYLHSFEATLVYLECRFYAFLKGLLPEMRLEKVYIPAFSPAGFGSFMDPKVKPYYFAIAFGAETQGSVSGSTTLTFTSPTVSGSNTFGALTVFTQTDLTISSVTWNAVSATSIAGVTNDSANERIEMWYIIAPAAGANNIVMTRSGATNAMNGYASYYSGCKQSGQPDAFSNNHNSSISTWVQSVTTIANNCWTICNSRNGVGSFSASTNTTFRSTAASVVLADNNAAITPAQSYSMTMTFAGSPSEAYGQMFSVAPVAVASTTGAAFLLNMV